MTTIEPPEPKCDHAIALWAPISDKHLFRPIKISSFSPGQATPLTWKDIFWSPNHIKFTYCPKCGQKLNWKKLEKLLGDPK